MFYRYILILIYTILITSTVFTQSDTTDLGKVLSLKEYLNLIKKNHPIAKQANLYMRQAQAELLGAKGGFDPKLYGDYEQKFFDNKNYFAFGDYGVKVPTWYGIEVKGAYTTARGINVNNENKLPSSGQAILGVSFPLLQNLMIDERRANLFKARQSQDLNKAERDNTLNDLGIESLKTYWKWWYHYQQMTIFNQALDIANQRFRGIKASYELGERMAMDTLESYTQVQDRMVQYNDARLEYQEATLKLANFLWQSETKPFDIIQQLIPENLVITPLSISAQEKSILIDNFDRKSPRFAYLSI